jgi:hypothetical protein
MHERRDAVKICLVHRCTALDQELHHAVFAVLARDDEACRAVNVGRSNLIQIVRCGQKWVFPTPHGPVDQLVHAFFVAEFR